MTLQSSLDSWWKLNETSATTVADSTGSGSSSHTAVLIGSDGSSNWTDSGPPVARQGKFGGALTLNGSDYAICVDHKGISGGQRRTLSLWFKTSTVNKPILCYGASGTGTFFKISLNGSGAAVVDLGGVTVTGGTGLVTAWHHLAVTVPHNGNSGGLSFVDGTVSNGSGTTAVNTNSGPTAVLKIGFDGSSYFSGQIDDVRMYNAELNATMISKVYGGGTGDFNRLQLKASGSFTVTASQAGDGSTRRPRADGDPQHRQAQPNHRLLPHHRQVDWGLRFRSRSQPSSGLAVSYVSSAPLIASVEGTTAGSQKIKVRGAGSVTITASQAGTAPTMRRRTPTRPSPWVTSTSSPTRFPGSNSGWTETVWTVTMPPSTTSPTELRSDPAKDRSSSTNHAVQGTVSNRPTTSPTGSTARVFSVTPPASPRTSPVTRASAPSLRSCARQPLKPPPPSRSGAISSPPPAPESSAQRQGSGMIDSGSSSKSYAVLTLQMASGNYAIYVNGVERERVPIPAFRLRQDRQRLCR